MPLVIRPVQSPSTQAETDVDCHSKSEGNRMRHVFVKIKRRQIVIDNEQI